MFKRLLGRGAESDLDRADLWLERGDPVGALGLARRHLQNHDARLRERAQNLEADSRRAALESILGRVDAAEAAGDREEALEWLESAFSYVSDSQRRCRLEERRVELATLEFDDPELAPTDSSFDPTESYELLISGLTDDFLPLYENRGPRFREAYLALGSTDFERALELFDELVVEAPADPILRFERGRARLVGSQWAQAREDFEAAWDAIGDRPIYSMDENEELDETSPSLRLPYLWAEACLLGGDPEAVLEKFGDLAAAGELEEDLIRSYFSALRLTERDSEAARFASRLVNGRYGKDRWLYLAWAGSLAALGEVNAAIHVLERSLNLRLYIPETYLAATLRGLLSLYLGMRWEGSRLEDDEYWWVVTPLPGPAPTSLRVERIEHLFPLLRSNLPDPPPAWFHYFESRFRELRGDEAGAAEAKALAVARAVAMVEEEEAGRS